MQFALAAANEALDDARWNPFTTYRGREMSDNSKATTVGALSIR